MNSPFYATLHAYVLVLVGWAAFTAAACAQDNFEIEVYGSETLTRGETGVELQSNFNVEGVDAPSVRTYPTEHSLNATVEISHGFTDWLQGSFYVLTSVHTAYGWKFAGDRIRSQLRIPEAWHWPIGLGLSAELGYQRPIFSPDTWTLELLLIVDKSIGRWYFAFNPAFDRSLHGISVRKGFEFSPNVKVGYEIFRRARVGIEYYSSYGPLGAFDPLVKQQHQLVPSLELDLPHKWDLAVGYGFGLTPSTTTEQVLKVIVGRRFGGKHNSRD